MRCAGNPWLPESDLCQHAARALRWRKPVLSFPCIAGILRYSALMTHWGIRMPLTLTFTDTDELLLAALHKRARAHGRSIEEEHRDILRSALRPLPKRPLDDILRGMPDVGADGDFERRS